MNCSGCQKEITPDSFFCQWCDVFIPSPKGKQKASLFARGMALVIDPMIAVLLYFVGIAVFGSISEEMGVIVAILFPLGYFIWFLVLLGKGLTPGKKLLKLQVVNSQTGETPGFGKMFIREIIGRILSGAFLGLGYLWALFDKNAQAWHDKLAGTVVVKISQK